MAGSTSAAPAVSLVALGGWLGASAFGWPHSAEQFLFSLVAGVCIALVGLRLLGNPGPTLAPYLIAVWLVLGVLLLPTLNRITLFNHVIVAAGILAFSHLARSRQGSYPGGG